LLHPAYSTQLIPHHCNSAFDDKGSRFLPTWLSQDFFLSMGLEWNQGHSALDDGGDCGAVDGMNK
jgi:hypothetical protein